MSPLTKHQVEALSVLEQRTLVCTVAGYAAIGSGGLSAYSTQTIHSLVKRGYARNDLVRRTETIRGRAHLRTIKTARITIAGRHELVMLQRRVHA